MKVLHIITGLGVGGAEMMLCKLLSCLEGPQIQNQVVSLTDVGPMGDRVRTLGVPLTSLGFRRSFPDLRLVTRLAGEMRRVRPDVVQTWMYHADLVGGLAARLAGRVPTVWNIRHVSLDPRTIKPRTRYTAAACARLSPFLPARIVCCAEVSARAHIAAGYRADKFEVIPNGFDLETHRIQPEARASVRQELGLEGETPLVGLAARFDPVKDHAGFVEAAARLHRSRPNVNFLLWGAGVTWDNPALARQIERAGLRARFHLLGPRDDTPRLMAALDVFGLSSRGEGFPNVVGEAMSCGVPCVVTDVGDAALIVGETGLVVPPGQPDALAAGWGQLLDRETGDRQRLGGAARRRIEECFSLPVIAARYVALYEKVIATCAA